MNFEEENSKLKEKHEKEIAELKARHEIESALPRPGGRSHIVDLYGTRAWVTYKTTSVVEALEIIAKFKLVETLYIHRRGCTSVQATDDEQATETLQFHPVFAEMDYHGCDIQAFAMLGDRIVKVKCELPQRTLGYYEKRSLNGGRAKRDLDGEPMGAWKYHAVERVKYSDHKIRWASGSLAGEHSAGRVAWFWGEPGGAERWLTDLTGGSL
jgi:hypothetical protein